MNFIELTLAVFLGHIGATAAVTAYARNTQKRARSAQLKKLEEWAKQVAAEEEAAN